MDLPVTAPLEVCVLCARVSCALLSHPLTETLPRVITRSGPRALIFKRRLYLPGSRAAQEEMEGTPHAEGARRLAFVEAVYRYLKGHYRFEIHSIVALSALLLHSTRGPAVGFDTNTLNNYRRSRSSSAAGFALSSFVNLHVLSLTPPYATRDSSDRNASIVPGLHAMRGAPNAAELSAAIAVEYAAIDPLLSKNDAEARFLQISQANPAYGAEIFCALIVPDQDNTREGDTYAGNAGAPSPSNSSSRRAPPPSSQQPPRSPPRSRSRQRSSKVAGENVILCVGHSGLYVVSNRDPLSAIDVCDYAHIDKWALDGNVFAWSIDDVGAVEPARTIFLSSKAAPAINTTLERYVEERVLLTKAAAWARGEGVGVGESAIVGAPGFVGSLGGAGGDSSMQPLDAAAAGQLPPIVTIRAAPPWPWLVDTARGGRASAQSRATSPSLRAAARGASDTGGGASTALLSPLDILRAPAPMSSVRDLLLAHEAARSPRTSPPARLHSMDPPLPRGWKQAQDPSDGATYFYRPDTGETTWRHPGLGGSGRASGPYGDEGISSTSAAASPDSQSAWSSRSQQSAAQQFSPSRLPHGWAEARDPSTGDIYFFNGDITQWNRPM